MQETHCCFCGSRLTEKFLEHEGMIPYCEQCGAFRFPHFNTAVSMIVCDPAKERAALIKQYGRQDYILVAGYVSKGESAEDAVAREVQEELGTAVTDLCFNESRYYGGSNTLMLNFSCTACTDVLSPNYEIDSWQWFPFAQAVREIKPNSLAKAFLEAFLAKNPDLQKGADTP